MGILDLPDFTGKDKEPAQRWAELAAMLGTDMANYIVCAFTDVAYDPRIVARSWEDYLARRTDKDARFRDGDTDMLSTVKKGLADKERWAAEWGVGSKENPYSPADYRRLDEILKTLSSRNAGGMDAQQEYTLRNCAQMALLREKCIAKGDKESIDKAKGLDKMIQDNLAAENLRKKDVGTEQVARLDGIVDALKKRYGFGVELTQEQAIEACSKWLIGHHYSCTRDAAEHMMLAIMNSMRVNSDRPTMFELPQYGQLDKYQHEFAPENSAAAKREKPVYEYLGISRGRVTQGSKNNAPEEGGITDGDKK